jgi:hypothetical protein
MPEGRNFSAFGIYLIDSFSNGFLDLCKEANNSNSTPYILAMYPNICLKRKVNSKVVSGDSKGYAICMPIADASRTC